MRLPTSQQFMGFNNVSLPVSQNCMAFNNASLPISQNCMSLNNVRLPPSQQCMALHNVLLRMSQNYIVLNRFIYAYLNVLTALEGLHYERIWEDCMRKNQCNVEYEYQISYCSLNEEDRRRSWSNWPTVSPSGCMPTFVSSPVFNCVELMTFPCMRNCLVSQMYTCEVFLGQSRWPCGLRVGLRPLDCWDSGSNAAEGMDVHLVCFFECCVAKVAASTTA